MTSFRLKGGLNVGHDYGPDPTQPHMVHALHLGSSTIVLDSESHNLKIDKREVIHPVHLEPLDRDT